MPAWGRPDRPLVLAHRGASAERPENTLAAFLLAAEQGADGVELDVVRCASGEVVVFHDDDLQRLAGRPEAVRSLPLAALREVRIAGEPIPTLDEVLAALAPTGLLVNIELKAPEHRGLDHLRIVHDDGLAEAVADCIGRHRLSEQTLVSSFHPLLLSRFRRAAPSVRTGLLFHGDLSRPLREAWVARWLRPDALHPEVRLVTRKALQRWRAAGRLVHVWTVDDLHVVALLAALGVDGIITNRPGATRAVLDELPWLGRGAQAGEG